MSAALKTGADARAMRTTKFPPEFSKKVDMTKINLLVIKKWVAGEVARILKNEDDVVTEMIFAILEGSNKPDIKRLQTDLTGFLDQDAAPFCLGLWKMCLSAQEDPNGIPKELLEAKKLELIQERVAEDKAREEAIERQNRERERDRELARTRDRERGERGQRRGGGGRGGRGRDRDRSLDRRPVSRDSRSPPHRRDGPRATDSYVPNGRRRRDEPTRRRSPSYSRSRSRSRSPPRRRRSPSSVSRSPPRRKSRPDNREGDSDRDEKKTSRSSKPRDQQQSRRRRSPDPSERRRRRNSSSSRSPPRRRHSDDSSRSPPRKRRNRRESNDLISRTDRTKDSRRLSRDSSSYSGAGAEEEVGNGNES